MTTDTFAPTIKTNGHARDLLSFWELSDVTRAEFDYLADDPEAHYSPRFFEYRGSWYDANDGFTRVTDSALSGWDGAQGESYFSAVLIRYTDDYQAVVIGYAHW